MISKTLFLQSFQDSSPRYLFCIIPAARIPHILRNGDNLPHFKVKRNCFKNYCFHLTVIDWNKPISDIRNSKSLISFEGNILNFIRSSENIVFVCNNAKRIQLLTRLRVVKSSSRA